MDQMVTLNSLKDFYRGRKVLITGHTGFKGSWLSIVLSRLGADIYGYALAPNTEPSLYDLARIDDLVSSTLGDIRDYSLLLETVKSINPEIVIHMAAQPLVLESYKNPRETYETNVMGTINLLEVVRHVESIRVVLNITTDKCYENREWHWGYREDDNLGGNDPYSNSKACSELVTSAYRNSFFNTKNFNLHKVAVATARAGNVLGGGDWAQDRLIPDFIRSIILGEKLKIRSPHAIRPWQHVLEPLAGYLILCNNLYEHGPEFCGGWNFGADDKDAKDVEWVAGRLCELWGDGAGYEIDASPQAHEANYLKLDCSKAKNLLGWHPLWNTDTTIRMVVGWYEAYIEGKDLRQICIDQMEKYFKNQKD